MTQVEGGLCYQDLYSEGFGRRLTTGIKHLSIGLKSTKITHVVKHSKMISLDRFSLYVRQRVAQYMSIVRTICGGINVEIYELIDIDFERYRARFTAPDT